MAAAAAVGAKGAAIQVGGLLVIRGSQGQFLAVGMAVDRLAGKNVRPAPGEPAGVGGDQVVQAVEIAAASLVLVEGDIDRAVLVHAHISGVTVGTAVAVDGTRDVRTV